MQQINLLFSAARRHLAIHIVSPLHFGGSELQLIVLIVHVFTISISDIDVFAFLETYAFGIVCIQQARSHDAIPHRSACAILRDRIGWRLQPIGVVLQTHEGKLSVIINGRNSAIAFRTSYGRSINDTSLIVQQEVSRKVFYVFVIVLIRGVFFFCCFINLTQVRTVGLERQCYATHRIIKLCHASVKRLVELIGTLEGDNERHDINCGVSISCISMILLEIKDVAHVRIVHRSSLHGNPLTSCPCNRHGRVLCGERSIHFFQGCCHCRSFIRVDDHLVTRESVTLRQRQRHVVDCTSLSRDESQIVAHSRNVVSMHHHQTGSSDGFLIGGDEGHGQLVMNPNAAKIRLMAFRSITCSRNDITRLRADADCLGGCRHSHRQQNCSCGASDYAAAT